MDRYRLIAAIVVLFVYLFSMFPIQTIITVTVIGIAYAIIANLNNNRTKDKSRISRRREALKEARIYLAPYSNIWRNLKLSNKYCSLRLGPDGYSISAINFDSSRSFKVILSKVHDNQDLWDMFCKVFDHNTTFDGLVQMCKTFQVKIALREAISADYNTVKHKEDNLHQANNATKNSNVIQTDLPKEKLDVNNASEVELTALPGVSIVMAKKLIKKREEIGGFKSVDDVCLFLHLKPHMQNQLKLLICVNKMKGSNKIKRNSERSIDL